MRPPHLQAVGKEDTIHVHELLFCSTKSIADHLYLLAEIEEGKYFLVCMSPEAALSDKWTRTLETIAPRVCLLALDEAHCMIDWYIGSIHTAAMFNRKRGLERMKKSGVLQQY